MKNRVPFTMNDRRLFEYLQCLIETLSRLMCDHENQSAALFFFDTDRAHEKSKS